MWLPEPVALQRDGQPVEDGEGEKSAGEQRAGTGASDGERRAAVRMRGPDRFDHPTESVRDGR